MINLLPESEKKKVLKEYRVRLGTVALLLLSGCFIAGTLFLVPSLIIVQEEERALQNQSAVWKKAALSTRTEGADGQLGALAENLSVLAGHLSLAEPTDLLSRILAHTQTTVTITRFSFARSTNGGLLVTLGGVATDRQALVDFSEELKKEPLFTAVNLPVSNLTASKSIPFSLTITVAQGGH